MDGIECVVREIVTKCTASNTPCSDFLAAFVARTIVQTDSISFALDRDISEEGLKEVIHRSVEKILEQDSPSMATMKMQVAFDTSRLIYETRRDRKSERNFRKREEKIHAIAHKTPEHLDENEFLSSLYDCIFSFIKGLNNDENNSKEFRYSIEKEVYAALESVFPKSGLKKFFLMAPERKKDQLDELSNVVLGIRLFNRECKNGKTGLMDVDGSCKEKAEMLQASIPPKIEELCKKCENYREAISRAKLGHIETTDSQSYRWKDELNNRRQFLSFLCSIEKESKVLTNRMKKTQDSYNLAMTDLRDFISNKKSIPKEYVFPKFEKIAKLWDSLSDELEVAQILLQRFYDLLEHDNTYNDTLDDFNFMENFEKEQKPNLLDTDQTLQNPISSDLEKPIISKESHKWENTVQQSTEENAVSSDGAETLFEYPYDDREKPVVISPQSINVAFEQLQLEYHGYCPLTIVKQRGLLLLGRPELGVVHYRGKNYAFDDKALLSQFMENPKEFIDEVKAVAIQNPELINLLGIQGDFPRASFAKIIDVDKALQNSSTYLTNRSKTVSYDMSRLG